MSAGGGGFTTVLVPFGVSQDVIRCHVVIYKGKKWVSHHGVMWGGNREVDEWRKGSIFGGMVRGSIPPRPERSLTRFVTLRAFSDA